MQMKPTAAGLVEDLAKVLGVEASALLQEIADYARPREGGHSDPSEQTIKGYLEKPSTKCNFRFAALLLDFLDDRQVAPHLLNDSGLSQVRSLCKDVLRDDREARYGRVLLHDSAADDKRKIADGCYVLIRLETRNKIIRQELLVLSREARSSLATYISPEFIGRGRWGVTGSAVCCTVYGRREERRTDFVTYALDGVGRIPLVGILSGLSSAEAKPVTLIVCAIQIPKSAVAERMHLIGDQNDASIRRRFPNVTIPVDTQVALQRLLSFRQLDDSGVLKTTSLFGDFNNQFPRPLELVDERILDFCRSVG